MQKKNERTPLLDEENNNINTLKSVVINLDTDYGSTTLSNTDNNHSEDSNIKLPKVIPCRLEIRQTFTENNYEVKIIGHMSDNTTREITLIRTDSKSRALRLYFITTKIFLDTGAIYGVATMFQDYEVFGKGLLLLLPVLLIPGLKGLLFVINALMQEYSRNPKAKNAVKFLKAALDILFEWIGELAPNYVLIGIYVSAILGKMFLHDPVARVAVPTLSVCLATFSVLIQHLWSDPEEMPILARMLTSGMKISTTGSVILSQALLQNPKAFGPSLIASTSKLAMGLGSANALRIMLECLRGNKKLTGVMRLFDWGAMSLVTMVQFSFLFDMFLDIFAATHNEDVPVVYLVFMALLVFSWSLPFGYELCKMPFTNFYQEGSLSFNQDKIKIVEEDDQSYSDDESANDNNFQLAICNDNNKKATEISGNNKDITIKKEDKSQRGNASANNNNVKSGLSKDNKEEATKESGNKEKATEKSDNNKGAVIQINHQRKSSNITSPVVAEAKKITRVRSLPLLFTQANTTITGTETLSRSVDDKSMLAKTRNVKNIHSNDESSVHDNSFNLTNNINISKSYN